MDRVQGARASDRWRSNKALLLARKKWSKRYALVTVLAAQQNAETLERQGRTEGRVSVRPSSEPPAKERGRGGDSERADKDTGVILRTTSTNFSVEWASAAGIRGVLRTPSRAATSFCG